MLRWAFAFLLLGLIAGLLGFTGIAGASVGIAKVLVVISLSFFTLLMVLSLLAVKRLKK